MPEFGRKDDVVAPAGEQPAKLALRSAQAFFGPAAVDVGRVDEGDAQLQGLVQYRARRLVVEPAGEVVRAEADGGDEKARIAESPELHGCLHPAVARLRPLVPSLTRGRTQRR